MIFMEIVRFALTTIVGCAIGAAVVRLFLTEKLPPLCDRCANLKIKRSKQESKCLCKYVCDEIGAHYDAPEICSCFCPKKDQSEQYTQEKVVYGGRTARYPHTK